MPETTLSKSISLNHIFRIMVIEDGKIKEFDTPQNLLANTNGRFYSMAKNARIV